MIVDRQGASKRASICFDSQRFDSLKESQKERGKQASDGLLTKMKMTVTIGTKIANSKFQVHISTYSTLQSIIKVSKQLSTTFNLSSSFILFFNLLSTLLNTCQEKKSTVIRPPSNTKE